MITVVYVVLIHGVRCSRVFVIFEAVNRPKGSNSGYFNAG